MGQRLFVALKKNRQGIFTLIYWKNYNEEPSTVVDHNTAYFIKLCGEVVLNVFDPRYEDLSIDAEGKKLSSMLRI